MSRRRRDRRCCIMYALVMYMLKEGKTDLLCSLWLGCRHALRSSNIVANLEVGIESPPRVPTLFNWVARTVLVAGAGVGLIAWRVVGAPAVLPLQNCERITLAIVPATTVRLVGILHCFKSATGRKCSLDLTRTWTTIGCEL